MSPKIHPTALIETGVILGEETTVWDNVHIRHSTIIGDQCVIGEKTYIAYGVTIGSRVKINAFVSICTSVTIEDGVMISSGTVFTNDRFPRATTPDLLELRSSEPDENTLPTLVREGATIGANCTIGNDLEIGRFAMVGMGSVVTRSVADFHLVVGNPARPVGCVCRCGQLLRNLGALNHGDETCKHCGRKYQIEGLLVSELGILIPSKLESRVEYNPSPPNLSGKP